MADALISCTDVFVFNEICVCMSLYSASTSTDESSQHAPTSDTAAYHESPSRSFAWAGPTIQRLTLNPGSTHEVHQKACFVGAGVYSVNKLRVSAGSTMDIVMVPQRCTAAAPIVVREAATWHCDRLLVWAVQVQTLVATAFGFGLNCLQK